MADSSWGHERLEFENDMQQYSSRVLVRNWADERQNFERVHPTNYKSGTKTDLPFYEDYIKEQEIRTQIRKQVRCKYDGRTNDDMFRHAGKAYQKNNITTYDQDYNQLPKLNIDGIKKRHLKPWQIEQKLETTNLELPTKPTASVLTGRAPGYSSETLASYRPPPLEALVRDDQRHAVRRDLSVDLFKPNVPAIGPTFAVPEYTGVPPQLHKPLPPARFSLEAHSFH